MTHIAALKNAGVAFKLEIVRSWLKWQTFRVMLFAPENRSSKRENESGSVAKKPHGQEQRSCFGQCRDYGCSLPIS